MLKQNLFTEYRLAYNYFTAEYLSIYMYMYMCPMLPIATCSHVPSVHVLYMYRTVCTCSIIIVYLVLDAQSDKVLIPSNNHTHILSGSVTSLGVISFNCSSVSLKTFTSCNRIPNNIFHSKHMARLVNSTKYLISFSDWIAFVGVNQGLFSADPFSHDSSISTVTSWSSGCINLSPENDFK